MHARSPRKREVSTPDLCTGVFAYATMTRRAEAQVPPSPSTSSIRSRRSNRSLSSMASTASISPGLLAALKQPSRSEPAVADQVMANATPVDIARTESSGSASSHASPEARWIESAKEVPPLTPILTEAAKPTPTAAQRQLLRTLEQAAQLCAEDAEDVQHTWTDASKARRHVYFDERRIHRQNSQRQWHYETRKVKRSNPCGVHTNKRQAMDDLMQRLQEQIEEASILLRPQQWGEPVPVHEPLPYEARNTQTHPILDERSAGIVRPLQLSLHFTWEVHGPPYMMRFVPAWPFTRLAHPHLVVASSDLGTTLLSWPSWLAPWLEQHPTRFFQRPLMTLTLPTFLLWRLDTLIIRILEWVLVCQHFFLYCILALAHTTATTAQRLGL